MKIKVATILLFLFGTAAFSDTPAIGTVLGVLEHYEKSVPEKPPTVRVIFQKAVNGWKAFESTCPNSVCLKSLPSRYPSKMFWTIAFDGKKVGEINSQRPEEFMFYCDVGQQKILKNSKIPAIGKPSVEFGGFTFGKVYRPLVALSKPYFSDPENWKSVQVVSKMTKALKAEFRKKYPVVTNCKNGYENIARLGSILTQTSKFLSPTALPKSGLLYKCSCKNIDAMA